MLLKEPMAKFFKHFSMYHGLPYKVGQHHSNTVINGVKHAWVQKSALRISPCTQPYTCCTVTTGFAKNKVHIHGFMDCATVHSMHRVKEL
jgi:hypothetical protein